MTHARDALGVEPAPSRTPLRLTSIGARYSLLFFVPMPFAEVDAGSAVVFGAAGAGQLNELLQEPGSRARQLPLSLLAASPFENAGAAFSMNSRFHL